MIKMVAAIAAMAFALPANASDENGDRFCLAQNIYFESANQSFAGRVAVANVVLNRVEDDQFPSTVCDVVYQAEMKENWKGNLLPILHRCQFSWYCDGKSDKAHEELAWARSLIIADNVLRGKVPDVTKGATHYHAVYVKPYWSASLKNTVAYGSHRFYE